MAKRKAKRRVKPVAARRAPQPSRTVTPARAGAVTAAVLGLALAYGYFSAPVSVTPSSPLNPFEPFTAPFTILNDGYVGLREVELRCDLGRVQYSQGGDAPGNFPPSSTAAVGALRAGQVAEASCKLPPRELRLVGQADLNLTVSYRMALLPWRKQQRFRFTTVSKGPAQLRWAPTT